MANKYGGRSRCRLSLYDPTRNRMIGTKTLLLFVTVTFCCFLVAADINDAKRTALKRLETLTLDIKDLANKTFIEVVKREKNLDVIFQHYWEFGSDSVTSTNRQIKSAAKSAYMLADLLGSSNDVYRCIEGHERNGIEDNINNYRVKFVNSGNDLFQNAAKYQNKLIGIWKNDYYQAIDEYADIYKTAVADVQKSTKETQIATIVRDFEQTTRQMSDIIISIHPHMAKVHIQVLQTMDSYLASYQQYARYRVDDSTKAIQKCFSRSFQQRALYHPPLF